MTKFAEYYLVIDPSSGKWKGICYSYPPKELNEATDIQLPYREYQLLKELKSLEQGYELLDSVKSKIDEVLEKNK